MPLEIAQFIAYVTLTITGLIVAIVSVRFSYLQNFGWKPIFMRTTLGLKGIGGKDQFAATMQFEFWNRRKYPVIVRSLVLHFKDLEFIPNHTTAAGEKPLWYIRKDGLVSYRKEHAVSPSDHLSFDFEAPFEKRTLDDLRAQIKIEVIYFDPRLNKNRALKLEDVYKLM